jgi:hypothetical protein
MDVGLDNLLPRILLTVTVLSYSLGPALVDFGKTHATNPLWTGHARFHVVWQVASYLGIGAIVLALIWIAGPMATERLYLAALVSAAIFTGFFATMLAMPLFGGKVADANGVPPFATIELGGRPVPLDTNVVIFVVQVVILIAALLLIR